MEKPNKRDSEVATRVRRTAEICKVSKKTVYRVISGDQKNHNVLSVYLELSEGENLLVDAVKKAIPFI